LGKGGWGKSEASNCALGASVVLIEPAIRVSHASKTVSCPQQEKELTVEKKMPKKNGDRETTFHGEGNTS